MSGYSLIELKARCTSCRKVYRVTKKQMKEARAFGCMMSPCCTAPATPEEVKAERKKAG
jgi:hypothetical protein